MAPPRKGKRGSSKVDSLPTNVALDKEKQDDFEKEVKVINRKVRKINAMFIKVKVQKIPVECKYYISPTNQHRFPAGSIVVLDMFYINHD